MVFCELCASFLFLPRYLVNLLLVSVSRFGFRVSCSKLVLVQVTCVVEGFLFLDSISMYSPQIAPCNCMNNVLHESRRSLYFLMLEDLVLDLGNSRSKFINCFFLFFPFYFCCCCCCCVWYIDSFGVM